jgi:hypothetical protein
MVEIVKDYYEKVKELKALGEKILYEDDGNIPNGQFDEIDCMDTHLEVCLKMLKAEA